MPDPITGPARSVTWEGDYQTWLPVAFFSWFEDPPVLHQLWVTPFGQTEWRKVESRNIKEWTKAYAECQAFNETPDGDLPF